MDDLAGLDWGSSGAQGKTGGSKPTAPPGSNYFPSLRPQATPTPPPAAAAASAANNINNMSGRSTPSGLLSNKPGTPSSQSKDSFANLFTSSSAAGSNKNLSLAEQQRRLQQQKLQQAGGGAGGKISEDAWAKLGGGGAGAGSGAGAGTAGVGAFASMSKPMVPSPQATGPGIRAPVATRPAAEKGFPGAKSTEDEDDILAAFRSDAPVDKSSHFPAPSSGPSSSRGTPAPAPAGYQGLGGGGGGLLGGDGDDDDPFGLGMPAPKSSYKATQLPTFGDDDDDDDFLGDLGKPVSELPPRPKVVSPPAEEPESPTAPPTDRGVAELVDMGFPAEKAQQALEATDGNVQAAVSWLLNAAHSESRSKTGTPSHGESRSSSRQTDGERSSSTRRQASEKDPSQRAQELGTSLWKGANALWKQGKKQLDKAVADFNTESDASQPKWMRDASNSRSSSATRPERLAPVGVTDEAAMLDSHDLRPAPRSRRQDTSSPGSSAKPSRDQSPALPTRPAGRQDVSPRPAWQQQQQQPASARSKLSRQMVEEEEAQMYVSSARRKKTTPKPSAPEGNLLDGSSAPAPFSRPVASTPTPSKPTPRAAPVKSAPLQVRPAAKSRPVPSVSAIAIKSCTQHRAAGTASFKRGDYSAAEASYSSAITALPSSHPLIILLLTNRATTRLKVGDTKGALADADQAIELVGPARGTGEAIEVPDEDGSGKTISKDMGPFWGKAIMKRAEALENMERWSDAAAAWKDAVEGGVGGANAIQARNRCEAAARPKPKSAPKPTAAARPAAAKPRARPAVTRNPESAQAVNRLREANKEAERVDEEKFRLADSVDERVNGWRKGKEANLRALIGSLDTVLWAESGWKKVNMSELIVPGKVKIAYMKGIAKVHPDKLPTTATTEQIMISGMVFSTLNEAWDKFKAENGL